MAKFLRLCQLDLMDTNSECGGKFGGKRASPCAKDTIHYMLRNELLIRCQRGGNANVPHPRLN